MTPAEIQRKLDLEAVAGYDLQEGDGLIRKAYKLEAPKPSKAKATTPQKRRQARELQAAKRRAGVK